jgi:hypothetical protein
LKEFLPGTFFFALQQCCNARLDPVILVNGEANAALVCGTPSHLDYLYPLPTEMNKFEKVREKTGKGYPAISSGEMEKILVGAADYCERLKQSAFYFICDEKIVETMTPLSTRLNAVPDITTRTQFMVRNRALRQIRANVRSQVNKYRFSYRLIKNKDKIIEKREIIEIKDKNPENINVSIKTYGDAEGVVKPTRFFSEKVIFAPITLFDIERQGLYD